MTVFNSSFVFFVVPTIAFFSSLFLWILVIRPYCVRHRKGYTPGANMGVTIWVDWQEASGVAKERGDKGMVLACRIFLVFQLVIVAAVLRAMFGG